MDYGLNSCKILPETDCQKDFIAVCEYLNNLKSVPINLLIIYGK